MPAASQTNMQDAPVDFFSHYKSIAFARRGRVLYVTFNSPDTLNAFWGPSHSKLARVFYDIAEDRESDIVVLSGAGRAFSAGGNLDLLEAQRGDIRAFGHTITEAKRVVFSMLDCPKPIVGKINGDAIGLGMTVALLCDVVIANEAARLADPHNNVGLMAGDGGAVIWPQLIGYAKAKHYLLTGERITGRAAADMGLIYAAYPAEELDQAVEDYVARLEALPPLSLRWTKATLNIPLKQIAHSVMDAGMAYEGLASVTQDHAEAICALKERRPPRYTGG